MSALPVGMGEGVDGELVEISRWCPTCRELVVAHERTSRCLWCDTKTLPANGAGATEGRTTMAAAAAAVETACCKVEGCTEPVASRVGLNARLCRRHAEEASAARRGNGTGGGNRSRTSAGSGTFTGHVRTLAPLARKVDKARAKVAKLPSPERAEAELQEAIRRVQGASNAANLARLEEATKALKALAPAREKANGELQQAEAKFRAGLSEIVNALRS